MRACRKFSAGLHDNRAILSGGPEQTPEEGMRVMRWKGRRGSSNIDDRRSRGRGGGSRRRVRTGGGLGLTGILVVVGIAWLTGVNPLTLLAQLDGGQGGFEQPAYQDGQARSAADDETAEFVSVILADTENTWGDIFREGGSTIRSRRWFCSPARCRLPAALQVPPQARFIVGPTASSISIFPSTSSSPPS